MRGVVNVKKLTCGPELVLAGSGGGPGGEVVMVTAGRGGSSRLCCKPRRPDGPMGIAEQMLFLA